MTLKYRLGSVEKLGFRPLQPDGTVPDLSGARMQLRVPLTGECVALDGVPEGDTWFVSLADLALRARLYSASIWIDWGDGWTYSGNIFLDVQGGC